MLYKKNNNDIKSLLILLETRNDIEISKEPVIIGKYIAYEITIGRIKGYITESLKNFLLEKEIITEA